VFKIIKKNQQAQKHKANHQQEYLWRSLVVASVTGLPATKGGR
jgi:hypothetical protein